MMEMSFANALWDAGNVNLLLCQELYRIIHSSSDVLIISPVSPYGKGRVDSGIIVGVGGYEV